MSQTYRTRHLTARDNALLDRLALHPRYAPIVERLRPAAGVAKPKPRKADDEAEADAKPIKPSGR